MVMMVEGTVFIFVPLQIW